MSVERWMLVQGRTKSGQSFVGLSQENVRGLADMLHAGVRTIRIEAANGAVVEYTVDGIEALISEGPFPSRAAALSATRGRRTRFDQLFVSEILDLLRQGTLKSFLTFADGWIDVLVDDADDS